MFWRIREKDFALYAVQSARVRRPFVMVLTEVALVALIPVQIGFFFGIYLFAPSTWPRP
jgi:hypothetical protein